jgi:hypothetical protein
MITLTTDQVPFKIVPLKFCTVNYYQHFVWTEFTDGSGYGGVPDPGLDYLQLAQRLGYPDAIRYCREHDFLHSALSEMVSGRPSPILWALAHEEPAPPETVYEEALVQMFQASLRGGLPMTATSPFVDWWDITNKIRRLLD